jgi:hypothetical protein
MGVVPLPRNQTTSDTQEEVSDHHRRADEVVIDISFEEIERFSLSLCESSSLTSARLTALGLQERE